MRSGRVYGIGLKLRLKGSSSKLCGDTLYGLIVLDLGKVFESGSGSFLLKM